MVGFLEITYGPMFAGKTSHLIDKIYNFITFNQIHKNKNPKILIINSLEDSRNLNKIKNLTTHNTYKKDVFPSYVENVSVDRLDSLKEDYLEKYNYIAIDEAQFFVDLDTFVEKYLAKDKYIHCCGLVADSDKKIFGKLNSLIPLADEVTQLKAFCVYCRYWYKNAVFTKWVGEESKKNTIEIGGKGKYVSVCGKHY